MQAAGKTPRDTPPLSGYFYFNSLPTSYLSRSKYEELSLVKDSSFIWLLGYDADTTVASSTCSYDRYVHFGVLLSPCV